MKKEHVLALHWQEWINAEFSTQLGDKLLTFELKERKPAEIEQINKEWIKQFHFLGWPRDQVHKFMPIVKDHHYSLTLMLRDESLNLTDDELLYKFINFKPFPWQKDALHQTTLHPDYWVLGVCGRGSGKSELLVVDFIRFLYRATGYPYLQGIISRSEKHAESLFERYKWYILTNPLLSWCIVNKTMDKMKLDTGAEVMITASGARGFHFNRLGLDEVEYQSREDLSAIEPAIRSKRGVIFAISTPRGTGSWLHQKWLSDAPNYIKIHKTSAANPNITEQDLENIAKEYPRYYFEQEYLARFIDWSGNVFALEEIDNIFGFENLQWHEHGDPQYDYYAGMDLGRYPDETVLIIMHQTDKGHLIVDYCRCWSKEYFADIANEIQFSIASRYNLRGLCIDTMGGPEASGAVDLFQNTSYIVTGRKPSIQWHVEALLSVKHFTETRHLHIPKYNEGIKIKKQLQELVWKTTNVGRRPIHPDNEESHDDTYSALALCIQEYYPYNARPELYLVTHTLHNY